MNPPLKAYRLDLVNPFGRWSSQGIVWAASDASAFDELVRLSKALDTPVRLLAVEPCLP